MNRQTEGWLNKYDMWQPSDICSKKSIVIYNNIFLNDFKIKKSFRDETQ